MLFWTGEPDDGFTYLKTVRWEANRLPDVHVSTVNPREFDSNQTRKYGARNISSTAPPERLPTPQWEENLLTSLNDLRSVRILDLESQGTCTLTGEMQRTYPFLCIGLLRVQARF